MYQIKRLFSKIIRFPVVALPFPGRIRGLKWGIQPEKTVGAKGKMGLANKKGRTTPPGGSKRRNPWQARAAGSGITQGFAFHRLQREKRREKAGQKRRKSLC